MSDDAVTTEQLSTTAQVDIWFVDDEADIRTAVTQLFALEGLKCCATANPAELLKALAAQKNSQSGISYNGIVLLTGQVPNERVREVAAEISRVEGVKDVHNQLRIGSEISFGTGSKDSWITTKIKTKLIVSSIQSRRILIITEAQTVFLMGLVSRYEADRITKVAQNTSGVKQVVKVFEYVD